MSHGSAPTTAPSRRRTELGWALYDWANSAFATTVLAGLFPVLFKRYWSADVDAATSTMRLGIANSVASLAIMLLGPILGAIADAGGLGKRLLFAFTVLGSVATGALWLVARGDWLVAAALFTIGNVGFLGGCVFYDALLVHVAEPARRDRVSALGYALGYLGGGLLFAFNVACVTSPATFGFSSVSTAGRAAFPTVGLWWLGFTLPLLLVVREPRGRTAIGAAVRGGLRQLRVTFGKVRRLRVLSLFLLAYWLYIDGVDTIIRMAVDYGMSIGLDSNALIVALLITQFVGFPAAIGFGKLGERFGAKRAVLAAILAYMAITGAASTMQTARTFYILAAAIGLVQGGVQALSRSLYSRLIPASQASEFFGFYNMLGKSAAVLGPLMLGLVSRATGQPRLSILVILVLLAAGAALLLRVDLAEGERVARAIEAGE
jgi:MFS transporter, UMF1 family